MVVDQLKKLVTQAGGSDHVRYNVLRDFARMRGIAGQPEEPALGRMVPQFGGYSPKEIGTSEEDNAKRKKIPAPSSEEVVSDSS